MLSIVHDQQNRLVTIFLCIDYCENTQHITVTRPA